MTDAPTTTSMLSSLRARCPVHRAASLTDGHYAWLVLATTPPGRARKDRRLSKDIVAALADDPDVSPTGRPARLRRTSLSTSAEPSIRHAGLAAISA